MPRKCVQQRNTKPDIFDLEPSLNRIVAGCDALSVLTNASGVELPDNVMWAIDAVRADVAAIQAAYLKVVKAARSNRCK